MCRPEAGAGNYDVTVGLYFWESMERLEVTGPAGEALGNEVTLTTLNVEAGR